MIPLSDHVSHPLLAILQDESAAELSSRLDVVSFQLGCQKGKFGKECDE
jgi:hypothetical protein